MFDDLDELYHPSNREKYAREYELEQRKKQGSPLTVAQAFLDSLCFALLENAQPPNISQASIAQLYSTALTHGLITAPDLANQIHQQCQNLTEQGKNRQAQLLQRIAVAIDPKLQQYFVHEYSDYARRKG